MAGNIYAWSQTAASNGAADSTINFAEGQLPGTLNDSDRAKMAVHAAFLADNNATGTTGGTGAAYTFTSALTEASLATGICLRLKMNATNTGACTLTLTPQGGAAFAAKAIRTFIGAESDPVAGQLQANGIYEFNYDAAANAAAGAWILLNPSTAAISVPGGRLTLTTATPVLIANATAQATVYYTPYLTSLVPINGTMRAFTEQSVVLDATNFLSGKLYDFFMFDNAGTPTLGYGPAWTNLTTRAAAIARAQGIWTNSASITLRTNSSTTFTIGANAATYVGTAYGTANGQTGMNFNPAPAGGGTANILGIFNTYNRVPMMAWSRDNTANWTYNSTVWRAANGNANNSISFIDGLGEVNIQPIYSVAVNVSGQAVAVGINLNSTSATPAIQGVANTTTAGSVIANALILPALGYNTLTAMEASTAANAVIYGSGFFSPAGQAQYLQLNVAI